MAPWNLVISGSYSRLSHVRYLNQYWRIDNWNLKHNVQLNINQNTAILRNEISLEIAVGKQDLVC